MELRAITVWEPYATYIACGVKMTETRDWSTPYRGPIAIHAGRGGEPSPFVGKIVAVTWLHDISIVQNEIIQAYFATRPDYEYGDFSIGRRIWHLRDTRPLPDPIDVSGKRGLWTVPKDIVSAIYSQIQT